MQDSKLRRTAEEPDIRAATKDIPLRENRNRRTVGEASCSERGLKDSMGMAVVVVRASAFWPCISTGSSSDCISRGFPRIETETDLRLGPFGHCEDQYGWALEVEGIVFVGERDKRRKEGNVRRRVGTVRYDWQHCAHTSVCTVRQ